MQLVEALEQRIIFLKALPNPNPGSSTIRSRFTPPICATSAHARSSRFTSITISDTGGNVRHSSGRPRMCISTAPHFNPASVFTIRGSQRNPLTSFTISAPAATAALATFALYVSTEISASGHFCFRAAMTGITRSSSSFSPTGCFSACCCPTGAVFLSADARTLAAGRVDSPPTSTMSAPSRNDCSPYSTAASWSKCTPPSENESGVTLTTAITSVRFPNCSEREPRFIRTPDACARF